MGNESGDGRKKRREKEKCTNMLIHFKLRKRRDS